MQNKINSLFFLVLFFLAYFQNFNYVSSANDYLHYVCGNNTENSTYQSSLATLFASLSMQSVSLEGFTTNTTAVPDQISGLALCRGDVDSVVCRDCLNQSVIDIQTLCPNSKEATIYYDFCLLRYSNNDFLSSTDNSQQVIIWNSENVTSKRFSGWITSNAVAKSYLKAMLEALLGSVASQAAYTSAKRFAVGDMNITTSGPAIYSMSQCTPDMAKDACHACLQDLINQMLNNFDGREGGRILGVRCSLRYEVYNFFSKFQGVLPLSSISGPLKSIAPDDASGNRPAPAPSVTPRPHNMETPAPSESPSVPDNLPTPPSLAAVPSRTNKGNLHMYVLFHYIYEEWSLNCLIYVYLCYEF